MAEYIEREAALKKQIGVVVYDEGGWDANVRAVPVEDIEAVPAADVAPVVHGRWGSIFNGDFEVSCCTNCMKAQGLYINGRKPNWPYCPNCGAKMSPGGGE